MICCGGILRFLAICRKRRCRRSHVELDDTLNGHLRSLLPFQEPAMEVRGLRLELLQGIEGIPREAQGSFGVLRCVFWKWRWLRGNRAALAPSLKNIFHPPSLMVSAGMRVCNGWRFLLGRPWGNGFD